MSTKNSNAPISTPVQYTVGGGVKLPTPVTTGYITANNTSLIVAQTTTGVPNTNQKKQLDGTFTVTIPSGVTHVTYTIMFSSNLFTSGNTYRVLTQYVQATKPIPTGWKLPTCVVTSKTASSITFSVTDTTVENSTGVGYVTIDWLALGY